MGLINKMRNLKSTSASRMINVLKLFYLFFLFCVFSVWKNNGRERKNNKQFANRVNEGKHFGIKMNIKKLKTMVMSRKAETPKVSITIDCQTVKQVKTLTHTYYLVSMLDGRKLYFSACRILGILHKCSIARRWSNLLNWPFGFVQQVRPWWLQTLLFSAPVAFLLVYAISWHYPLNIDIWTLFSATTVSKLSAAV